MQKGYSLIETLVAMALLLFVVISILAMFSSRLAFDRISKNRLIALSLAQDAVEYLRSLPLTKLQTYDGYVEDYGTIQGYPNFRREYQIQLDTPVPGLHSVTVIVRWKTAGGFKGNLTLRTTIKEQ